MAVPDSREPVEASLKRGLAELSRRYGLAEVYAFGSRVREIAARLSAAGNTLTASGSDVDIGVRPRRGSRLAARDKVRLAAELEDLLEVERVDLVVLTEASAFLALDVIRGELLYATDLDAQAEYELYVLRRAGDLADVAKERRRLVLEEGAR